MDEYFSEIEAEQRRTETLRQLLAMPPQQHASHPPQTPRSRKKAGPGGGNNQTETDQMRP